MAKAAKKTKKKIAHGSGVCEFGRKLIRDGKTNEQVLAAIMKKFPESRVGMGGVGWLRNDLRKKGENIQTNTELKAAKPAKKAAA